MLAFVRRSLCSPCLYPRHNRLYPSATLAHQLSSSAHDQDQDTVLPQTLGGGACQSNKVDSHPTINRVARKAAAPMDLHKEPSKTTELKVEATSRRNLLEQTKVQEHLDYVASTNEFVTLADIERCKPRRHGAPGTSQYESEYNALLDTLVRSFSAKQLRQFLSLYHLNPPTRRTKWNYAVSIIERQWNWPSLTEIQKQQRDWTEVADISFPLDPRQSFLILGRDGTDLLSLSLKHNVHVSFSANPLSLKVEGLRGSLDNISRHIADFKADIKTETFELPAGRSVKADLWQRISRLSGAFVESSAQGTVRISYRGNDHRAARMAKRLATRAACESSTEVPILVHSPEGFPSSSLLSMAMLPYTYSLFPFLSSRSLPWAMNMGSMFRLRRVGEWLGVDTKDDVQGTGGLAEGNGTGMSMNGERSDIRDMLLNQLTTTLQGDNLKRAVIASLGHVLLSSPSPQQATIAPPLKGLWELSKLLEWMQTHTTKRFFVPSLPVPLLISRPTQQRLLHRLVYNALPSVPNEGLHFQGPDHHPTMTLSFELVLGLPGPPTQNDHPSSDHIVQVSQSNRGESFIIFPRYSLPDDGPTERELGESIILTSECWVRSEGALDLMMPDRSMDIRFSVVDSSEVHQDQWPQELRRYHSELQAFLSFGEQGASQPDTPLTLVCQDTTYVLLSSTSVRQSVEPIPAHTLESSGASFRTISESILDLESNQKSTICQVTCEDITSEDSWKSFLIKCDRLTAPPPRPPMGHTLFDIGTLDRGFKSH